MKYKVGDEFIVKIKEVMDSDNGTLYRSNFNTLVFDEYGLDKLQKYDKHAENLERNHEVLKIFEEKYNQGLQDAWELARKISDISTTYERADMFGYCCNGITVTDVLRDFTPQEALAKIEAYEESKAIKVGDVVKVDGTNKDCGIVIAIDEIQKKARLMYADTSFRVNEWYLADLKKTGRHIDISSILEQIRGDE